MPADPIAPQADPDGLMAELYEAAQGFAVRHGFKGTFIEVVLELWDALRACAGGGSKSSRRPRRRPDHPPVCAFPQRHEPDRGPSLRQHPRSHGVAVRPGLQELFGATSWQTLGFDEPVDELPSFAESLDRAIEDLYGCRRRVGRAPGKGPSYQPDPGGRIPAGDRGGPAGELRAGRSRAGRGTGPGSGGCPGPAE